METVCYHKPVMLAESAGFLVTDNAGIYIDCTFGGGGHSGYLLEKYPGIRILGLDWDEDALEHSKYLLSRFGERVKLFQTNFKNIRSVLTQNNIHCVNGILADLGVSSHQLDERNRGFSFESKTLDMRMSKSLDIKAEEIVNSYSKEQLEKIFIDLGEERNARRISERIVEFRKNQRIDSAEKLADIAGGAAGRHSFKNPATKIFQALRIYVNSELENLVSFLNELPAVLCGGGRAVIISYHSLEDRIVKNSFREKASGNTYKILTKKVVIPSEEEIRLNARSRSAKLRAVEKI